MEAKLPHPASPGVPWGLVFRICLISLLISRVGELLCAVFGLGGLWSTAVLSLLSTLLPAAAWHRQVPVSSFVFTGKPALKTPFLIAGGLGGLLLINALLSLPFSSGSAGTEGETSAQALVVFALIPAVGEELLYRGMLWKLMELGSRRALLIGSSLCFAMGHRGIGAVVFALIAGLLLGLIRLHSGSLAACMVTHGLHNALSLLLTGEAPGLWFWVLTGGGGVLFVLLLPRGASPASPGSFQPTREDLLVFGLFAAAALLFGLI